MDVHVVIDLHVELDVLLVPVHADFLPRTSAQTPQLPGDHGLPAVVQRVLHAGFVQSSWV